MKDKDKTKEQLIDELVKLRRRVAKSEALEAERKRAEEALRENERRRRAVFDQTYQFIGLMTPDGTLIEANRAALRFSGIKESEVLGRPFWETPWWTHSPELQERLCHAVKTAASGRFIRFEATHRAHDGSLRCVDFSLKPVKDEAGNVVFLIPEGRDITDRKQAEDELKKYRERLEVIVKERTAQLEETNKSLRQEIDERKHIEEALGESRRKLFTLMGNLPGMAYRCLNDEDWTMEFVSGGCLELTGYEPSDLIGNRKLSYSDLIHPDDRGPVWDRVQKSIAERRPFHLAYRIQAAAGEQKWVWEQGVGVFSEEGELFALEGFVVDITKRKTAEEALRESEKTLSEIVQRSSIPTFVIDNDHTVTHWNKACENLTGISANEVIGTRKQWLAFYSVERPLMADLMVDDAPEKEIAKYYGDKYRASAVTKGAYEAESFFPELGERGKWLFFTAAPLKDAEGKVTGAIETLQDVTERNLAEEALRLDESRLETLLKFSQMAEASLDEITDFALEQAIRLTRSKIGYLAFTNEDETVLTMHSWSKSAMEGCAVRDKPIVYPLETTGLWGEAVRQRKPIIINDYAAPNPLKKGYPKGHVHLNRHMNIPVFNGGRIVAVAGVGNKDEEYDESDVRQLTLLMQGMWRFLERKQADEELRKHRDHLEELVRQRTADLVESEEKYRTLVENVPLVVYRMGPGGETLFVNHFVKKTFGYNPAEIFRNPEVWYERVFDEDRVKVEKLREKNFREGKEFIAEYRVRHKNGSIVYVMDHAIPFEAADGLIGGVDGIIMDVTGRVKLQEKLVRAEGLKTISEVSARLAHEIRNPLVSAGGFARRLLSSMSQEDPNRAKVEIIVREVARLEIILRMMLNYIHPFELEKSPIAPNQLVERALSAVETEIKERNVSVDLQLAPGLLKISADRPQMELAVETLVKQALNQMQEGATLSVWTFQENGMFNLVMRYPVQHMAPDDVEHFFYPFTTSKMGYDTADLPMSKIVVDKHGGVIDVSLEESGELIIHISLPHVQTPSDVLSARWVLMTGEKP